MGNEKSKFTPAKPCRMRGEVGGGGRSASMCARPPSGAVARSGRQGKPSKAGSPPSITASSYEDVNRLGVAPPPGTPRPDSCNGSKLSVVSDASRSRSGSATSNAGSVNYSGGGGSAGGGGKVGGKKSQPSPCPSPSPMTLRNRQLIQSCFQNPHESLGKRILKRSAEKRKEIAKFYMGLSFEQKEEIGELIKSFLKGCVASIDQTEEVQRMAEEFGSRFVQYRAISFKVDYFSAIADSTITECAFLDNAVHPAHQTLTAFSQFITTIFTAVRDGFYAEMRRLRRTSNTHSTGSNGSGTQPPSSSGGKETVKKLSLDSTSRSRGGSPRSLSPGCGSAQQSSSGGEENSPPLIDSKRRSNASSLVIPSNQVYDDGEPCTEGRIKMASDGGISKSTEILIELHRSPPETEGVAYNEGEGSEEDNELIERRVSSAH